MINKDVLQHVLQMKHQMTVDIARNACLNKF